MSEDVSVERLEQALGRAWPAAEVARIGGWELREAGGHSRRANSANPFPPDPPDLLEAVDAIEEWYLSRRLRPVVRLTPASDPVGLEEILENRGWDLDRGTLVMAGPVMAGGPVDVASTPTVAWLDSRRQWDALPPARWLAWRGILDRIPDGDAGFGLLHSDGEPVAAGHAVVDGDLVGLYGLVVDPARRRGGHGERLSRGLIAWGAGRGATTVYLQVHSPSNPGAVRLYERLGLESVYEYRYRQAPR